MNQDIHIPPEAVEAAARAIYAVYSGDAALVGRPSVQAATAAIRAALEAWPGVEHQTPNEWSNKPHIILPMTEPRDE